MTASTIKSENITNIEATPITVLEGKAGLVQVHVDTDNIPTTSIDEADDIFLLGVIPSNAIILDVEVLCDDLDANATPALTTDFGLYYSGIGGNQLATGKTSGTVIDADCFATAVTTFQAAKVVWTQLRFEVDDIIDVTKEAWEVGGLSADPGGLFYCGFKVVDVAATAAAGDVVLKITYLVN